jgi:DMSO/TMAO reductase YedYZ molybdopterin-dependent catalytic subunit
MALLAGSELVVLLAQLPEPDSAVTGAAVVALGLGLTAAGVLRRLVGLVPASDVDRRRFLAQAAAVGVAVVGAGGVLRLLVQRADVSALRAALRLPPPVRPAPGDVSAADLGVPGVGPVLTPNADFYRIDTALFVPQVDPRTWSLRIDGLVERSVSLTLDELLSLRQVEADITLSCVSNRTGGNLVGTARWQGVLLSDVLRLAGIRSGAEQLVGRSVDGFTAGFPIGYATDGRPSMIALAMNGEPLPIEHGFPARLVVPGLYGYVSATKWLTRLSLTTWEGFDGFWVPRGWSKEGPIKTSSRIDVPQRPVEAGRGRVAAGPAGRRPQRGHLAAVELGLGRRAGLVPAGGPGDRRAGRRADRRRRPDRAGRRDRLPRHRGRGPLRAPQPGPATYPKINRKITRNTPGQVARDPLLITDEKVRRPRPETKPGRAPTYLPRQLGSPRGRMAG